jgi:hypothetical protein
MSTRKKKTTATRRGRAFAPLLAVATLTLLFAGTGAANASGDPDPVGDLVKKVHKTVDGVVKQSTNASVPSQNAPDPTSSNDDDSPGHETANPQAPDHGSSHVGHAEVPDQDLADVGAGNSTVNDDDSTTADSTLLAIGGQEVIGSHASSDGANEGHGQVPGTTPLCEQSDGQACLDLLYADSYATENDGSSSSRTSSGVANLCLGGADKTGESCDAPAQVLVAGSRSSAHRDKATGRTTTSSDAGLVGVCLQRDPVLHTCTVSADVLSSDGAADSDGTASRHSDVANLAVTSPPGFPGLPDLPGLPLPGTPLPDAPSGSQPFAFSVPMDCATPSLVCIFGNQGETYFGHQLAGTAQTALDLSALDETVQIDIAHSETLAHNDGGRPPVVSPPTAPQSHTPIVHKAKQVVDGILPNTGGVWSGLLALGLGLFAVGAIAAAWDRRRAAAA